MKPGQLCLSKAMNRLVQYLKDHYEARQKKNPKYSLRSFARDLSISSGRLVTILNQKDLPGDITLNKIFKHLKTPEAVKETILKDLRKARLKQKRHSFEKALDPREISHMAHWEVWAVYTLMQKEDFDGSVEWLVRQTQLNKNVVVDSLTCLTEIKLVQCVNNKFTRKIKNVTSGTDIPSKVLRELHKQFIQRAVYCIDHVNVEKRDISGMTLCMEPEKMEEAKLLIAEFRSKLTDLVGSKSARSELHQLSIQFFPLVNHEDV